MIMEKKLVRASTETRKYIDVELPDLEGGIMQVYTSLFVGEAREFQNKNKDSKDMFLKGLKRLFCHFKSWNLADQDGKPLELSLENVEKYLSEDDIAELMDKTGIFEKKTKDEN